MRSRRLSSSSRCPWRWASASSATHSVAVLKITRWPARHARMPIAVARWSCRFRVAQQDDVLFAVQEVELAEVLDNLFLD